MRALARMLAAVAILACLVSSAGAQTKDGAEQLERKRYQLSLEQSQRHLEYGLELRKQGMTTQAAEQIILAAEIGQGRNPGASQVLYMMRQYDAAFWKRHGSRPTPGKVESYAKKSRGLLATDRKETLDLANWAWTHDCEHQAQRIYGEIIKQRDESLEFDAKGQIVLQEGTIPKGPSILIKEGAIEINGKFYVRDALLSQLTDLKQLVECSSDALRVRTTTTLEQAQDLHAMCTQLLPALAADLGASPRQRLTIFVFAKRAEYEQALDALGRGDQKVSTGMASPSPLVALLCAEGQEPDILRGLCLHEVTHLYFYAITYSIFPSWYWEGYADTYGGTETFTWQDGQLELGGLLARSRIDGLKVEGGSKSIAELLAADQLAEWRRGEEAGLAFYAQSWAFLRYLRTGAGAEIAARLEQWEERCIGQALGFELGAARSTSSAAASSLFTELFGKDLAKLEAGFKVWLAEL